VEAPRTSDGNPVVALPGLQDDLFEILAHELRTPLHAARWLAEVVEASADEMTPGEIRRASESLLRSLRYMDSLLESMLGEADDAASGIRLQGGPLKVDDLARQTVEDVSGVLGDRLIVVSVDGNSMMWADPDRVRQALIALLVNAARHSPEASPVSVRVTGRPLAVEVAVSDHCTGIPVEARERIFEHHSRLDGAGEGRGVGLFVARRVARAHGGDLRVSSHPSWGCRFVLSLPRRASASPRPVRWLA
jgi:signal transduction histidine kinase